LGTGQEVTDENRMKKHGENLCCGSEKEKIAGEGFCLGWNLPAPQLQLP
jgi:hypothetical protein